MRVSFLVISYNQERYIKEAIVSALGQDYANMELVISDDGSSDNTWEVIQETVLEYKGLHKVIVRKNETNKGLAVNFNKGIQCCSGELIVVQAGDDISESHRVSELVRTWTENNKKPDLIYSNISRMDEDGNILGIDECCRKVPRLEDIKNGTFFIAGGMAAAYTRSMFEKLGLLHPDVRSEDYVLTFRALILGGVVYNEAPLVKYRIHDLSIMGKRRRIVDQLGNYIKNSRSDEIMALDRLTSWNRSEQKDLLFWLKLKREYRGLRLFRKYVMCDKYISRIVLILLMLISGRKTLFSRAVAIETKKTILKKSL